MTGKGQARLRQLKRKAVSFSDFHGSGLEDTPSLLGSCLLHLLLLRLAGGQNSICQACWHTAAAAIGAEHASPGQRLHWAAFIYQNLDHGFLCATLARKPMI